MKLSNSQCKRGERGGGGGLKDKNLSPKCFEIKHLFNKADNYGIIEFTRNLVHI
jgi:hypothetical protein